MESEHSPELNILLEYEANGVFEMRYKKEGDTLYIWPKFNISAYHEDSWKRADILEYFFKAKREYARKFIIEDNSSKQVVDSLFDAIKNRGEVKYDIKWQQFEDPEDDENSDMKLISIE